MRRAFLAVSLLAATAASAIDIKPADATSGTPQAGAPGGEAANLGSTQAGTPVTAAKTENLAADSTLATVPGYAIQVGAALGPTFAEGSLLEGSDNIDTVGPGISVIVDYPLNSNFGVEAGASWSVKGTQFGFSASYADYAEFRPSVQYMMFPLMLRVVLPAENATGVVRLYARAGVGPDLLLSRGGTMSVGTFRADLARDTPFYDSHERFNLSLLYGGGLEIGLSKNPGLLVGADVLFDNHLLDEFKSSAWNGYNYQYRNIFFGVHIVYQTYTSRPKGP